MAVSLPILHHTSVADVSDIVDRLRKTFHKQKTKPLSYRLVQLRKLYWGLKDNEEALFKALRLDLGKPGFESYAGEVGWCENDIIYVCDHLEKWARDEKPPDVPLLNTPLSPRIRKDPLGVVLVIGAFNYPVQLSLGPFIGAIAAGCTALLKPSEVAPHTAAVLQKTIEESLDPSAYAVVQGGVPETTELLSQKWDKIFYTGSSHVGKIIAKKAAETLTPVTLELGGQNPAIVTRHADPSLAARRLLWGKVANAGQVCLAENYVLVDKEILPSFVAELEVALTEFFPRGAKESPDYARVVNQRHYHRIKSMLDQTGGKILFGGAADEDERFIEPTVVQVDSIDDSLMQDEIFGPLLPIYPVDDLDDAIRVANEVSDTPLALYPFGNKDETDRVLREVRSGGASINE
ncbi:MAG: hypothetical protein M1815_002334 [Lichina confinis]|nr:MAG: hypothetical protein M1815_002334 [Lichina confinis]